MGGAGPPPRRTCPNLGAGGGDAPHAAEEPRQTRGEAPHRPWATGAGGRVCRAPAPCGRGTATGGARMDRAPCARDHTHQGRARRPAAPHTSDVPQLPLAARDNERRAHGPCAHASGANRRTQYRAARRRWTTQRQFAAGASAPMGRCAERRQGGRECVRPWRRDRESFCGREASAKSGTPRGKPTPNGQRLAPTGALLRPGPQAVSRPQAMAPGPHPST